MASQNSFPRRVPSRIRTCDLLVRNQVLYPLSYEDAKHDVNYGVILIEFTVVTELSQSAPLASPASQPVQSEPE